MTYPPGNPGYPPAQQPNTQFSAPTQQFGKLPEPVAAGEGPSRLPLYLAIAVAALGLLAYVFSYFPLFTATSSTELSTPILLNLGVVAALLAALTAGVGLLPKQNVAPATVAILSVLGFLLLLVIVLTVPDGISISGYLYAIMAFSLVQAIVAVVVLLFDAGVITPPVPRPRYEQQQQQYGQYGGPGPYYGQPHQPGPPHQQHQQRPGYPSPYGGGYPGGPAAGHYQGQPAGPPTPPTGFPAYGQPPSNNVHPADASSSNAPTSQVPTTQAPAQPSSSNQSGPPPS
jgi:uncharacterized protein DUF5336